MACKTILCVFVITICVHSISSAQNCDTILHLLDMAEDFSEINTFDITSVKDTKIHEIEIGKAHTFVCLSKQQDAEISAITLHGGASRITLNSTAKKLNSDDDESVYAWYAKYTVNDASINSVECEMYNPECQKHFALKVVDEGDDENDEETGPEESEYYLLIYVAILGTSALFCIFSVLIRNAVSKHKRKKYLEKQSQANRAIRLESMQQAVTVDETNPSSFQRGVQSSKNSSQHKSGSISSSKRKKKQRIPKTPNVRGQQYSYDAVVSTIDPVYSSTTGAEYTAQSL